MERLLGDLDRHALDLEQDAARANHGDPAFNAALAGAHAGLGRLLGERVIGEHPDIDLSELLDRARDRDAGGLDLARGEPAGRGDLETVVAERHLVAALGATLEVALVRLAKLRAF